MTTKSFTKNNRNKALVESRKNKNDEYYTQLCDIEKEMNQYEGQFKNKTVFCNCDDPYESNFFKYFALNFNKLGLKKLIATCYTGSPIANTELSLFSYEPTDNKTTKVAHKIEITEIRSLDITDIEQLLKNKKNSLTRLAGDGDFRSEECIELLKESDIVVTNPPFSLFRQFISQLLAYNKKFIVLGNKNAITYKEIFKLFQENVIRLGHKRDNKDMFFAVPDSYDCDKIADGQRLKKVAASWYTNLDVTVQYAEMELHKRYTPEEYPLYDNYDAIEVSKLTEIPYDYDGVMAVPITFIAKHNPNRFEILGIMDRQNTSGLRTKKYTPEDTTGYEHKNDALNSRGVLMVDGRLKPMYARILIRRKHNNSVKTVKIVNTSQKIMHPTMMAQLAC